MAKINVGRLVLSTLLVAVFYFIADGVIHGAILDKDANAAIEAAGKPVVHDPIAFAYFGVFDLGKAFVAMFIYVLARDRFSPGVRSAVIAGLLTWLAVETLPNIAQIPMPFVPAFVYWKWIGLELVPCVVGAVLGAWIYKEG